MYVEMSGIGAYFSRQTKATPFVRFMMGGLEWRNWRKNE